MTCTTPLQASLSGIVTVDSLILTPELRSTLIVAPLTVVTSPLDKSVDKTLPSTTWYFSTSAKANPSNSFPANASSNASSVGAKTVKGPLPMRTSSSPVSSSAPLSVSKPGIDFARAAMLHLARILFWGQRVVPSQLEVHLSKIPNHGRVRTLHLQSNLSPPGTKSGSQHRSKMSRYFSKYFALFHPRPSWRSSSSRSNPEVPITAMRERMEARVTLILTLGNNMIAPQRLELL
mmetsp:Transcript_19540/g.36614  ORF Transcript_19540/g.36614 Transcript_19540/m.36614 type:complete len:234 (+) Transcript_19540:246-947(+)